MAPLVHGFDPPERFVAGTVGPPGSRTFFLQARTGARVVSVALEKQQVAALAQRIDELLDEVMASELNQAMIPAVAPLGLDDADPLEQPIEEEFRAGTMRLSWVVEWRSEKSGTRTASIISRWISASRSACSMCRLSRVVASTAIGCSPASRASRRCSRRARARSM